MFYQKILLLAAFPVIIMSQTGWILQNSGISTSLDAIYFVNSSTGLAGAPCIRTMNGGLNWLSNPGLPGVYNFYFTDINTGYAAYESIYKTINGGINWVSQGGVNKRYVQFVSQDTGFAAGYREPGGLWGYLKILKTTNGGAVWIDNYVIVAIESISDNFSTMCFKNRNTGYVAEYIQDFNEDEITKLYKTNDAGGSWTVINLNDSVTYLSMQYPTVNTGYCIGMHSTLIGFPPYPYYVYKIVNDLMTIKLTSNNELNSLYFVNDNTGFVCGSSGRIFKTTDGGDTWASLFSGTSMSLNMVKFVNEYTGYICGSNGVILKTTNAGEPLNSISGTVRYQDNSQPVTAGYVKALKYDYQTQNIITVDSTGILSNGAYTLTKIPRDSVDIMAFQDDEETAPFVPTYYVSTIYWQYSTTLFPTGNLTNIDIAVKRQEKLNGALHIAGYIYSNNSNDFSSLKDAVIYSRSSGIFRGHSISITNGHYNIDSLTPGVYELIADRMGFSSDLYIISLTNSSLENVNFYLNTFLLPVVITGVNIQAGYTLQQNYPNPFNPNTLINFSIPKTGEVKLDVYDITGKKIASLVNEVKQAGNYWYNFNASGLATGVYLYSLIANGVNITKKMILVK